MERKEARAEVDRLLAIVGLAIVGLAVAAALIWAVTTTFGDASNTSAAVDRAVEKSRQTAMEAEAAVEGRQPY